MRTIRSLINYGVSFAVDHFVMILGILATPYLIRYLGHESFGVVQVIKEWTAFLVILQMGTEGSLLVLMVKYYGEEKIEDLAKAVSIGVRVYFYVMGISLVGLGIFVYFAPHIINHSKVLAQDISFGTLFAGLSCLFLPFKAYILLLQAEQRTYLVQLISLLQSVLIIVLSVLFSWLSWGVTGYFIATFIGSAAYHLAGTLLSYRRNRSLPVTLFSPVEKTMMGKLLKFNKSIFLSDLAGRFGLMADNIILSFFLGPKIVVAFYSTQRLLQIGGNQLTNIANATWASLGDLYARQKYERFNEILLEISHLIVILSIGLYAILGFFNFSFIKIWLGPEFYAGDLLTSVVAVNFALLPLQSFWGWCFVTSGTVTITYPYTILKAVINIIFSLYLTSSGIMEGPVIGTCISFLTIGVFITPWLLKKIFGIPLRKIIMIFVKPIGMGIVFATLVYSYHKNYPPEGWIGLMMSMFLFGISYLVLSWIFLLTSFQKILWIQRLTNIRNKLRGNSG